MEALNKLEKAAEGLRLLEEAIVEELRGHPQGLGNSELARALQLESDHQGRHDNYLTYSVVGGLLKKGEVVVEKRERRNYYLLASDW